MRKITSRQTLPVARLGIFLGLCLLVSAQDVPVAPPSLPQQPGNQSQQQPTTGPQPSDRTGGPSGPGAPVNSSSYKIGAADILNIHVWNEAQFSGPAIVHEDGMFTLPLIGDLKAGGMTPVEVEKEVGTALSKYVRQPLVTITVQQVGSKQYFMDGEINHPGEYPLVIPTTILEAISKAGGPQPFANRKKIYVLRGTQRIQFNYKDVVRGKHMDQNIHLQPGDHVVVP